MKMFFPLSLALAAIAALAPTAHAATAAEGFQLDHLRRLVSLGQPQISPDGTQIALVVSTPNWKTDKADEELDLVDAASGARRALTYQRTGLSAPHWSPDGRELGFIADDPKTGKPQLFVLPMAGGDARRVTDAKQGVESYSFSPDGQRIAYVTEDEPANAEAIKAHDNVFEVTDNNFLVRAAVAPWHLWVISGKGGKATRLTEGKFSLQTDQRESAPTPAWSRDGKHIAYVRFPGPYWGPSFHSVIDEVDASGGKPHVRVDAQGAANVHYAPDSNRLAFTRPRNGDQNNGNAVYVGGDTAPTDATAALARNINDYAWLPGGRVLLLQGELGTNGVLWRQPVDGKATRIPLGAVQAEPGMSVARNGAIAFIGSTAGHPGELYVMKSAHATPRRLTDLNGFVDKLSLGRTEPIRWSGSDGFAEDGVLTYPVDYHEGRRYPLVLVIHGGPQAASTVRFSALSQLLAAQGFVVFQPNYRGSTNLGDAYQHAIYRDTGDGPSHDVMAGLAAVEKLGMVDSHRIGVSGWSYGGYMTTWLTGHYDVWKAAVAGAALTDWVMDYTVAYYQTGDLYFFGGSPWKARYREIWRQQSPINFAQNVTAPTLILGDVGDPNVPLLNGYEWYHALRDNGVPVKFFAYPADTHFPKDIVRSTDVYRRWVGWMNDHLKPTSVAR